MLPIIKLLLVYLTADAPDDRRPVGRAICSAKNTIPLRGKNS
jgi:hypothetical protein